MKPVFKQYSVEVELEAVAEVLAELLSKLFLPVADFLHAAEEEAEHFWLFCPLKTTDERAVVPKPLNAVGNILELRECVNTARNSKTLELEFCITLCAVWLALLRNCTTLHTTDTTSNVESCTNSCCWILVVRHFRNESTCVQVASKTTWREDYWYAVSVEFLSEVVDEFRTVRDVVHIE